MTQQLSPAAQALAWAYDNAPRKETGNHRYHWLAAALRAAADQVVPQRLEIYRDEAERIDGDVRSDVRQDLLAIAAELGSTNPRESAMEDLRQASADVSGVEVLSPAAQAVLDATNQAYDTAATVAEGTAVALRAAATAIAVEYSHLSTDGEFFSALRKVAQIADELET